MRKEPILSIFMVDLLLTQPLNKARARAFLVPSRCDSIPLELGLVTKLDWAWSNDFCACALLL